MNASPPARRFRLDLYGIGIVAVLVLGLALRLYHLGTQSLWVDELGEGTTALDPMSRFVTDLRADFGAAPLDYLGVKLVITLAGHGTVATRTWAFAMGSLGVLMIFVLGRRLFGDPAPALIAAGMLALSAFDIYYSQEARFYALSLVAGMLNLWAFLRALESKTIRDWIVYSATALVALYSHFFLAALLPVEGIYLAATQLAAVWSDRSKEQVYASIRVVATCLVAQAAAFLLFLPWLLSELSVQGSAGYPELPALTLSRVHQIFVVLIAMAPLNSLRPNGLGGLLRTDLVLALAAVGAVWELCLRRWRAFLLLGIIAIAIPLAWRSDQLEHYFWAERQVIFVLVPIYLLAGAGLWRLIGAAAALLRRASSRGVLSLRNFSSARARAMAAAVLAVVLIGGWAAAYRTPMLLVYQNRWAVKEDWSAVASYIGRHGCPDSQYWTFLSSHYSYGVAYYDPSLAGRAHYLWALPGGGSTSDPVAAATAQNLGAADWIILSNAIATTSAPDGETYDAKLRALGWQATPFVGLMVYNRSTCGGP